MTLPYKVGDAVLLSREREGVVRYIGNVHFSKGIWCGIELVGGSLGTNDGKWQGRRYFTCGRNRGLFVRIGKVRRKFREKDHSSASRQKRKASLEQRLYHKSLVQQAVAVEMKNVGNSKRVKQIQRKGARNRGRGGKGKTVKVGDIEITQTGGRNSRLSRAKRSQSKPASNNKADWLTERLNSQPTKQKRERAKSARPFKPGPRDIGRIDAKQWTPIDYEDKSQNSGPGWMNERLSSPTKRKRDRAKTAPKPFKPGPRDIGRNDKKSGWKPIELSKEEEAKLNSGSFLQDRGRSKSTRRASKNSKKEESKPFKPGPRDIGRNSGHNWEPIALSAAEEAKLNAGSFLDDRSRSKSQNAVRKKKPAKTFKPGPRDIGRNSGHNWKPINLSKEEEAKLNSGSFLQDRGRSKSAHPPRTSGKGKVFKPGPRDIGRNDNWKPKEVKITKPKRRENKRFKIKVNDNEVDPKKLSKISKAKNKELMKGGARGRGRQRAKKGSKSQPPRPYKPGPRDIGKNNTWKQKPIPQSKNNGKRDSKKGKGGRVYKPGPRDIGRNNGYNGYHDKNVVITQTTKNQGMWKQFRRNNKRRKAGPRDIGRNDGYDGYDHDKQRQSMTVKLNQQNQAKKSKHKGKNSGDQERHSISVGGKGPLTNYTSTGARINGYNGYNKPQGRNNGLWTDKNKAKKMYNRLINGNKGKNVSFAEQPSPQQSKSQHTRNGTNGSKGSYGSYGSYSSYGSRGAGSAYTSPSYGSTSYEDAKNQRAAAYADINPEEFTAYDASNGDTESNGTRSKKFSAADEDEAGFDLDEDYRPYPIKRPSGASAFTDGQLFDDLEITDDIPRMHDHVTSKTYGDASEDEKNSHISYGNTNSYSNRKSQSDILSMGDDNHEPHHHATFHSVAELFSPENSPIPELPDEEAQEHMTPVHSIPTTPTHFGMDIGDEDLNDTDVMSDQDLEPSGYQSGSMSPSGHHHLYNGDTSPSGHDHIFDFKGHVAKAQSRSKNEMSITATLFSDSEDNPHRQSIKQYLNNGKMKPLPEGPLPPPPRGGPPSKPLPKNTKGKRSMHQKQDSRTMRGRIKGIEKYMGKWIITFNGMKPSPEESKAMMKSQRRNSAKRGRSSGKLKKKNGQNGLITTYTYSIYKDGSVQIQPKSAFGWNGSANVVFDGFHKRFEIHANDLTQSDEYDIITMNRNNTLKIEHFNISSNNTKPIIGTGIKG